jgi:hypothetical protein
MYNLAPPIVAIRLMPFFLFSFLSFSLSVRATNWQYSGNGNWTAAGNWSTGYPGTTIAGGDTVFIMAGANCAIPASVSIVVNGVVVNGSTFSNSGSFTMNGTMLNAGLFTNSGIVNCPKGFITNRSDFSNGGVFNLLGVNGGSSGSFVNSTTGTLTNSGSMSILGSVENSGNIGNTGTISDSIILRNLRYGTIYNSGTILVKKYALLYISDSSDIDNAPTGILNNLGSVQNQSAAYFKNEGSLINGAIFSNSGEFENYGRVISSYSISSGGGSTINNFDSITLNGSGVNYPSTLSVAGYFHSAAGAIVIVNEKARIQNIGNFTNDGILNVESGGTLENNVTGNGPGAMTGIIYNIGTVKEDGNLSNAGQWVGVPNSGFTSTGRIVNTGFFQDQGNNFNVSGSFDNASVLQIGSNDFLIGPGGSFQCRLQASVMTMNDNCRFSNYGSMLLKDASAFSLQPDDTVNNYGKVIMQDKAYLFNYGTFMHGPAGQTAGADIDNEAFFSNYKYLWINAPFHNNKGFYNANAASIISNTVNFENLSTAENDGHFTNYGGFSNRSGAKFANLGTFDNSAGMSISGEFDNYGVSTLSNNIGTISINADGLLQNANTAILRNNPGEADHSTTKATAFRNPGATITISGKLINFGAFSNDGKPFDVGKIIVQDTFSNFGILTNNDQFQNVSSSHFLNNTAAIIFNSKSFINEGSLVPSFGDSIVNFFSGTFEGFTGSYSNYSISAQPANDTIPANGSAVFKVATTGTPVTYQWQVSIDNGKSWENLSDNEWYKGTKTAVLQLISVPAVFNGYQYRAFASGPQPGNSAHSQAATLKITGGRNRK